MRSIIRGLTLAGAVALAPVSLEAQAGPPVPPERHAGPARPGAALQRGRAIRLRAQARHIRQRAAARGDTLTPRQVRHRMAMQRGVVREQLRNLTPEQRDALRAGREAMRAQRQSIGAELRAGTITREQARERMEAWRREHRPNAALRGPRPPGGGY